MENLVSMIKLILWLIIVPIIVGIIPISFIDKKKRTFSITYIGGLLISLAVFEIISIACMLQITYEPFLYCVKIYKTVMAAILIIGMVRGAYIITNSVSKNVSSSELGRGVNRRMLRHRLELLFSGEAGPKAEDFFNPRKKIYESKRGYSLEAKIMFGIFFVLLFIQLYMAAMYASFDGDDAYYVVESVLTDQTNTMNTILPYTGGTTTLDVRHALAVVTMWIAFIARVSNIHAAIVSHLVMPVFLIPLTYLIYYEISKIIFTKKADSRPMFLVVISVFNLFGHTSISTAETFFLTRTWQGKSMFANITVPLLVWLFIWLSKEINDENTKNINGVWILIILTNMVSGMFTSLGVMLGALFAGVYVLILMIKYKKLKLIIPAFISVIPNIIYMALYVFLG